MTIPEEIEQLKIKLENTVDEREQAEVLMELLEKNTSLNSAEWQLHIQRLSRLAEKLNVPVYKAWAFYYHSVKKRKEGAYDASLNLCQEALSLFEQINHKKGLALSYYNIGYTSYQKNNYPEAIKNHFSGLRLFEEIGDKAGMAESLLEIGVAYLVQDDFHEALKHYFVCLRLSRELKLNSITTMCYFDMVSCYRKLGDLASAFSYAFDALKVIEEIDDKMLLIQAYSNIGFMYLSQGNNADALKNHFRVLKLAEEVGDKEGLGLGYTGIGLCYHETGNYPEAEKCHFTALNLYCEIGGNYGMSVCYNNIGNVYFEQGLYQEALKNYNASLKLEQEGNHKFGVVYTYNKIGNVYEKEGNYNEAGRNQLLAIQIGEEISAKPEIKDSYLSLTNIYKATNDFQNALKYYEKYHQVEKEMLGEESIKQINNLSFTHNLEQKEKDLEIEQLRNVELKKEKDRSEALLLNILPSEVAEELKNKGSADAKLFDDVTVLFTDFKSFTTVSERLSPQELVDELNTCFSAFDEIMGRYNIEKIKTVGDAYLAVSGLPLANSSHASDVVNAAIEIREFIKERKQRIGDNTFDIRIGVHSGSVVAGIVGVKKFAYDIWGDTVNTAARMEQNSEAGKINISEATYQLVKDNFNCKYRGEIEAKNKGKMRMYFAEQFN
jgi:adenylate cyclase